MKGLSLLQGWKERWRMRQRNEWARCSIRFDAEGVEISDLCDAGKEPLRWRWANVHRLTVFKRDLLTVDSICLRVDLVDDRWIELDEEMKGWDAFVEALPLHLPGCKHLDEWFSQVAFPPFAPNATEIYQRKIDP
jgi:hypothetical protein